MSDNDNNNNNSNNGNILKELSDIKSSLATNTAETQNITKSLDEVKSDVKEMKKNYITQEQHKSLVDSNEDHEHRIRRLEFLGAILIGISYVLQFYFNFLHK